MVPKLVTLDSFFRPLTIIIAMQLHFLKLVTGLLALGIATSAFPTSGPAKRDSSRTTPPSGCITAGTGGTYSSILDAVAALGSGSSSSTACIFVYSGTYVISSSEQIYINYAGNLTLYGETTE
jgi:pectinesterase